MTAFIGLLSYHCQYWPIGMEPPTRSGCVDGGMAISNVEAGRYEGDTAAGKAMREGQRLATSVRGVGTRYLILIVVCR